jgi:nicotinamidase-related amidase
MTDVTLTSDAEDSVFVIVDVQQRLAAAMPQGVKDRVVEQLKTLIIAAKTLSIPIVVTEQYPKGLGSTEAVLQDYLPPDATIIEKTSFSCVKTPAFFSTIEKSGRKKILLTGMETHICVLQTALDFQQHGYQVFVVEDAVSSRSKANQYNALQRLRNAGIIVTTVESVVFEWLADAKHPQFKTLAQLIV